MRTTAFMFRGGNGKPERNTSWMNGYTRSRNSFISYRFREQSALKNFTNLCETKYCR